MSKALKRSGSHYSETTGLDFLQTVNPLSYFDKNRTDKLCVFSLLQSIEPIPSDDDSEKMSGCSSTNTSVDRGSEDIEANQQSHTKSRAAAYAIVVLLPFWIASSYAFLGFMAMTAGKTVLAAALPHDEGYMGNVHLTMQVGAVGGAITGGIIYVIGFLAVIMASLIGCREEFARMASTWKRNTQYKSIFWVLCGTVLGPLGVAVLRNDAQRGLEMLTTTYAAREGAFGMFLMSIAASLLSPSMNDEHGE
ncbi:hypothetical protein WOLCODRAFT_146905 [Wolfiporia cocos MD-104 SS10]|uniref:Uncharacterized protein n=1 Tax=Wolfiporia cocos (strain MD-104) TaxID=742152 RepID=A0A2H3JNN2_WOLCO|nr:hypothetical protein WOLCODRAFT_146905 [Wolfiporia cocos MD-104 SS10]